MRDRYGPSAYDDSFCLKPPALLWLAAIYFARAITLPMVCGIGAFAGVDSQALALMRRLWSADALVPSLIACTVLYAFCRRTATPSRAVRWIWTRGRMLLGIAGGLDIVSLAIAALRQGQIDDLGFLRAIAFSFDLYFLAYVLWSRRVRDVFADLPPAAVVS